MRNPRTSLEPPRSWTRDRQGPRRGIAERTALAALALLLAAGAGAADPRPSSTTSLADLPLEDLVNVKVTSVSKREEKLNDTAAAIFVLTSDDLRRSGVTTVADALRLVPGVQVAAIDSGTWAVSARGFNSEFANKLLVMIDGRTVYSPLFSGVYWDVQQVALDDVDRIEVIRGPGATVWGANAVNGVINILTKSARDTLGGLLSAGGGDVHRALGAARYGAALGTDAYYRVYGIYQLDGGFRLENGRDAGDGWDNGKGGFRIDRYSGRGAHLTWQGDGYTGHPDYGAGRFYGFNTLGRWTQPTSDRSGYELQAYLDHTYRNDSLAEVALETAELSFQSTFGIGKRNDAIWGLGYRYFESRLHRSHIPGLTILEDNAKLDLFSAFIQDEVKLVPRRLTLTFGTKVEHNDFTGIEIQPSARIMYKPAERQTVWAAVSRAVRTPTETEGKEVMSFALGPPVIGPGGGLFVPTTTGNPDVKSEVLWAYELGYRSQPVPSISIDVSTFFNRYDRLVSRQPTAFIPGTPVGILDFEPVNTLHGESHGGEASLTFAPNDTWRLIAGYSLLHVHIHGELASDARILETSSPEQQAVVRSSYEFARRASLDAQLRYVDRVGAVAAYVTADLRFAYRPKPGLELSLVGQNLLSGHHAEHVSSLGAPTVEVPRGFYGKIAWRF